MAEESQHKCQRVGVGSAGERVATGIFLLAVGAAATAFTYVVLYMLILGIMLLSGFENTSEAHWLATGLLLVAGLYVGATSPDCWNSFSFDTRERKENDIFSFMGVGRRLYRVDPLGPRSLSSIVKVLASPLLLGPGLVVESIREFASLRQRGAVSNRGREPEG